MEPVPLECGDRLLGLTEAEVRLSQGAVDLGVEGHDEAVALLRHASDGEALRLERVLAALEEYLHHMDAAVKADDWETYIDNALRFHRRLVESSGNRTFLSVWDSLLWDIRGRIALRRHAEMGKSLKPLLAKADTPWDKPSISQVRRNAKVSGYSLRTERYRYSQWGENGVEGEELYDYSKDPRELRNLAKDPQSSGLKAGFKKRLNEIVKSRTA